MDSVTKRENKRTERIEYPTWGTVLTSITLIGTMEPGVSLYVARRLKLATEVVHADCLGRTPAHRTCKNVSSIYGVRIRKEWLTSGAKLMIVARANAVIKRDMLRL